jgi:hypothetical protein
MWCRADPRLVRDANRALYVLALGRLSYDERTRAYAARRTTEGKTKREIIRCMTAAPGRGPRHRAVGLRRVVAAALVGSCTRPPRSPRPLNRTD